MQKTVLWFSVALITQCIAIIMWGEHMAYIKLEKVGEAQLTPLANVDRLFWIVLVIEIVLFIVYASNQVKPKDR